MDNPSHPTKATDVYAFGVMTFEVRTGFFVWCLQLAHLMQVLTGRPPFFGMTEVAATYSMLSGSRPLQPDDHELSDRVWRMIQSCWDPVASRRMPIKEVVALLEAELCDIPTPST